MPTLANKLQPVRVGVLTPKPVYSRIVPVWVGVGGGAGMYAAVVTDVLSETFWLLEVQIWVSCTAAGFVSGGDIYIQTGPVGWVGWNEIINDWDPVLDMSQCPRRAIYWEGFSVNFDWKFEKHYSEFPRRFGIAIRNYTPKGWRVVASFKIAEG